MKVQLPADFTEITLREYIAWHQGTGESRIAIFVKEPHKVKLNARNNIYQHLQEIFSAGMPQFFYRVKVNGKTYGFINDWDALSTGEYIDIETYADDPHKLMSILYRPVIRETKETYEIEEYHGSKDSEVWLDCPASWYLGAVLFFCKKRSEYLATSQRSLLEVMKQMTSTTDGDGTKLSSTLRDKTFSRWTLLRSYLLGRCSRIWRTLWTRKGKRMRGLRS